MVYSRQTGDRWESRILPNNRAIVLHQGGQCRWAGGVKEWSIRTQQPRSKQLSCKAQGATLSALHAARHSLGFVGGVGHLGLRARRHLALLLLFLPLALLRFLVLGLTATQTEGFRLVLHLKAYLLLSIDTDMFIYTYMYISFPSFFSCLMISFVLSFLA